MTDRYGSLSIIYNNLPHNPGYRAHGVPDSDRCKYLPYEHGQVQAFSKIWPVHDYRNLLPSLGDPVYGVLDPGYRAHGAPDRSSCK